jgi:hypothetical protein
MQFINPITAATYTPRAGQADVDIIMPTLNWRSKLSRITPRIAEHLLAKGTNLFTINQSREDVTPTQGGVSATEAPAPISPFQKAFVDSESLLKMKPVEVDIFTILPTTAIDPSASTLYFPPHVQEALQTKPPPQLPKELTKPTPKARRKFNKDNMI